jgi:hypothetical protein
MFPTLGFSALYFLTDKLPRFQNGSSGWCSYTNDYLEIDLFFVHKICALKLGGDGQVDRWILWYSRDRKHWSKYRQVGGYFQVFVGRVVRWSVSHSVRWSVSRLMVGLVVGWSFGCSGGFLVILVGLLVILFVWLVESVGWSP